MPVPYDSIFIYNTVVLRHFPGGGVVQGIYLQVARDQAILLCEVGIKLELRLKEGV